jgi:hypothetical protein
MTRNAVVRMGVASVTVTGIGKRTETDTRTETAGTVGTAEMSTAETTIDATGAHGTEIETAEIPSTETSADPVHPSLLIHRGRGRG